MSLLSAGGMRHRGGAAALLVVALAAAAAGPRVAASAQSDGLGSPRPFSTAFSGDHGTGRIDPGDACAEGGDGGSWHYDYEAALPAGIVTGDDNPLPGSLRLHVDLHSEDLVVRATPGEPSPGAAWLEGTESTATFANQRGTLTMPLTSAPDAAGGGCDTARTLQFDGTTATGGDLRWRIAAATGSYRDASGTGSATLEAAVAPGADNAFSLSMEGDVAVLQPSLELDVLDTYWAFLGAHYLKRRVTAVYRVTNAGPGDAFGVRLTAASSPTAGVKLIGPIPFDTSTTSLGPVPQHLGDLPAGASEIVRLRWQLPVPSGDPPCGLVILGCEFDTTLTFDLPDALDVVEAPRNATVVVRAPDFPPPVVD